MGLGDKYWYKEAVPIAGRNDELRDSRVVSVAAGFNHSVLVTGASGASARFLSCALTPPHARVYQGTAMRTCGARCKAWT